MKKPNSKHRKGFTLVELLVVIAIIVALAALATPQIFKALKRAAMAEAINNVKQVKLALDSFAMDFDGQYPNKDTSKRLTGSEEEITDANTAYRQLFFSGDTQSEKIFWVKGSSIATSSPDDKITDGSGTISENEILKPGDCHWAYVSEQSNVSNPSRPLVLDSFKSGEDNFDPTLWDNKAVVLRIDSSARAERLGVTGEAKNKVLDSAGENIFSTQSAAWVGSGLQPSQLLEQPLKRSN
ncbi:MAG: prepilin-type N-terminal cleavage/methylation domain-containing protein [Akkermansiaceae bacterium]|nr:prepilin-type N-terminal cleavage/methylation domain-containing protein [Akkermansiaceae bacterium]